MSVRVSFPPSRFLLLPVVLASALAIPVWAQAPKAGPQQQQSHLTPKQQRKQLQKRYKELSKTYKKWLDEDVPYIITPQERKAFLMLSNDEERDQFIEAFWQRRNPDPDSSYNSFKEEYYRRIAYANEHFANGVQGWRTDRGRIYIEYGPPDERQEHTAGETWNRPMDLGGGTTTTFPWEKWRYRYIPGIGENVELEFVDQCMCGDFRLTMNPNDKDALVNTPGAGLTMYEQMGLASKNDRFMNADHMAYSPFPTDEDNEFTRLDLYTKILRPPKIKYKDLSEAVSHNIIYNTLPFAFRTDFVKITDDTVLTPFTIQIPDRNMVFKENDGVQQARVNIFGRISTMTGRTVDTFENAVKLDIPAELLPQYTNQSSRYWHGALLKPGRYRVDLVLKDVNSPDHMGSIRRAITVPRFTDTHLATSTIMLADEIERVPARQVGAGEFVVGDTKIRPVVGATFHRNQAMGIWFQVYNLKVDPKTRRPEATLDWQISRMSDNKVIFQQTEKATKLSNAAEQMTLEKRLPLASLQPGNYRISVRVTDDLANTSVQPESTFTVVQ